MTLVHAALHQAATLTVRCRDGIVTLRDGRLDEGQARVALDAPIDLEVTGWTPKDLHGRFADGRDVALRIEPASSGESALDVALVVDHSSSMAERCVFARDLTKHDALMLALYAMANRLRAGDALDLWQFNDTCGHVGAADAQADHAPALLRRLDAPSGGTEIGGALDRVVAGSNRARYPAAHRRQEPCAHGAVAGPLGPAFLGGADRRRQPRGQYRPSGGAERRRDLHCRRP